MTFPRSHLQGLTQSLCLGWSYIKQGRFACTVWHRRFLYTNKQHNQHFKDHYKTLGVHLEATPQEIKSAFFELSKKLHPDRNKAKNAHQKFTEINEAYEVIGNPLLKREYDEEFRLRNTSAFTGGFSRTESGNKSEQRWKSGEEFERYKRDQAEKVMRERKQAMREQEMQMQSILRESRAKLWEFLDTYIKVYAALITVAFPLFLSLIYSLSPRKRKRILNKKREEHRKRMRSVLHDSFMADINKSK